MSPITYQEAYDQTNPSATDEQRATAAGNIMAGVAANEAYWNSRSELEALKAQASGHSVVTRGTDEAPTVTGTQTDTAIEGTATEEAAPGDTAADTTEAPATAVASALGAPAASTPPPPVAAGNNPSPDNPVEAVAKLRAQLQSAGINPEA